VPFAAAAVTLPPLPPPPTAALAALTGVPIARLLAQQFVAQLTRSLVCGAVPSPTELSVVEALAGLASARATSPPAQQQRRRCSATLRREVAA
jgi:hypothetical protein